MEVVGPIAIRKFVLEKKCETSELHAHNHDHVTVVYRGSIIVKALGAEHGPYNEGESVLIRAGVEHEIKAVSDGAAYWCIFSHRDFDGAVIQNYNGRIESYV